MDSLFFVLNEIGIRSTYEVLNGAGVRELVGVGMGVKDTSDFQNNVSVNIIVLKNIFPRNGDCDGIRK